jgi:hypothetical protein
LPDCARTSFPAGYYEGAKAFRDANRESQWLHPMIDRTQSIPSLRPYVQMVKDGTYQVKVPLVGHAFPHALPQVFYCQEDGEHWMESPPGRELIKQVRDKFKK